ncbi:MAG TPA: cupredoxin domain-containing protein [Candidatus Saccharimonadales bacterium]|nr:cupredoxin domain-containing protein [Candidatus Saccharimonadales bacterium]
MDKIIAVVSSIVVIGFVAWWFFGKRKTEAVAADVQDGQQTVEVKVDGGYVPNVVTLKQGVPAKIMFTRKDPSSCLEEVVFPDFGIRQKLPFKKTHAVAIDTSKPGEFKYACGMNMFFGKVVIK